MNLLQLAQRVHREAARSGSGPTSVSGATKEHQRLFDWVADAWLVLQSMPREWRWMRRSIDALVTSASQQYAATDLGVSDFGRWRVPTDTYTVRGYLPATPESVWRMKWLDEDRFTAAFLDSAVTAGVPQVWSVSADNLLLLGPLPDQDCRIKADYFIEPIELADDADEPNMPSRHHMLLVWMALVQVAKFDAAPELLRRAQDNVDAMMGALLHDQAAPLSLTIKTLA